MPLQFYLQTWKLQCSGKPCPCCMRPGLHGNVTPAQCLGETFLRILCLICTQLPDKHFWQKIKMNSWEWSNKPSNLANQVTTCILYQILISSAILAVGGLVEFSTRSRIAMLLNSESMVASFRQMPGLYGIRCTFFGFDGTGFGVFGPCLMDNVYFILAVGSFSKGLQETPGWWRKPILQHDLFQDATRPLRRWDSIG